MRRFALACVLSVVWITVAPACAKRATPALTTFQRDVLARQLGRINDTIPVLRFAPPRAYARWRAEVEACSGLTRTGWPAFYLAPIYPLDAEGHIAMYLYVNERILFALGVETDATVVRHELLHWLLIERYAHGEHPAEYFGSEDAPGRCTTLVMR